MPLSTITFYETRNELNAGYNIYLRDAVGVDGKPLPSETFIWTVCAADATTLDVVHGNVLTGANYRFSNEFQEQLVTSNINTFGPSKIFEFRLDPQIGTHQSEVYRSIIPMVSGGTSFQIFTTGTNDAEITVYITNYFEESYPGQTWLLDDGINPLSTILSGSWWDAGSLSLVPAPISGVLDYMSGNVRVDWHNVDNAIFETNLSALYVKYAGHYLSQFNLPMSQISAARLEISLTANDTQSIFVSCSSMNPDIIGFSTVFHPYRIAIIEDIYNFTTANISAVYQSRNTYTGMTSSELEFGRYNGWPINEELGRAMIWKSENPNSYLLSAYSSRLGGIPSAFPISGWSKYIDEIQLLAAGSDDVYYVSACFPDDTLGRRTTAVYQFDYRIPLSETLSINTETYTLTTELLKVYRTVVTSDGSFTYDPVSALTWKPINSFPLTNLTASSGVAINDYSLETYLVSNYFPLTGNVGLVSSVPLCSDTGILTAYDYVYGVDYLKISYDPNPDIIYTYSVAYKDTPTISATHTFQVYSAPSAIVLSALSFNNQPFTRSLTAKVMNDRGGTYLPLHPANKIRWNFTEPATGALTIENLNGGAYTVGELADDTMVFSLSTSTFDLVTVFPMICTFNIQASAYDTYTPPYSTFKASTNKDYSIDTFPSSDLFRSELRLWHESSDLITDMWRVSATPYVLSAVDYTTISGSDVVSGTRLLSFGDGRTTTVPSTAVNYNGVIGVYNVLLDRTNVSALGWLSAHSIESDINLHLITQFISADFMVYPTYVFASSAIQYINTFVDPITTNGASSYDVGHTEPFKLLAFNNTLTSYNWRVGTTSLPDNTPTVTHNVSLQTSGLPVTLEVYNNELTNPMPSTYKDDATGVVTYYPNKKTTDNLTLTTQDIRVLDYEAPQFAIDPDFNNIILIYGVPTPVRATTIVTFPTGSPVVEVGASMQWLLSSPKWTVTTYTADFDYDITLALTDDAVGNIEFNSTYPLILYATRISNLTIPNTFPPNDWGYSLVSTTTSIDVPYTIAPEILFYPVQNYVAVGATATFVNETTQTSSICAFYLYDGYSTSAYFVSPTAYNSFNTSYPIQGTFSLYVTAVFFNNLTYSTVFSNAIHVISAFEEFDESISRVLGSTVLTFPNSHEDTIIPPNEWATANNFNRSMERLNNNFEYLKDMTSFYSLPPINYFGWLGSAITYSQNVFKWHYNTLPNYQELDESLANEEFSAVSDVVVTSDYIYVADGSTIKIYTNALMPITLNTITNKTLDDPLVNVKSIAVDSTGKIYALDRGKNRVIVFNAYIDNNPNSNKFLFEWGGLGGPNAKSKLYNPNELIVDTNDDIWVTDTGNRVIKKYTKTGSWLQKVDLGEYVDETTPENGGIISVAIDSQNDLHVLTDTTVFKFSNSGVFLSSYVLPNSLNGIPQKIIPMYNGGFLYVCFDNSVVKIFENGNYAGIFAIDVSDAAFTSIYQDTSYNLYLANTKNVLKYFDMIVTEQSRSSSVDQYFWNLNDITIEKDEYIQDWVCNMVFKRMWDNMELFRRSLIGQIVYVTNANGLSEIQINDFTPDEYDALTLSNKDDLFIGINEIVTSDTLNRCITRLYEDLDTIKNGI